MRGNRNRATRWSYGGPEIHPRGKATPKRRRYTGITNAAATPPALNSAQRTGSLDCFATYDLTRNQTTTREIAAHAA